MVSKVLAYILICLINYRLGSARDSLDSVFTRCGVVAGR